MPRLTQFAWVSRLLGLFCTLTLVADFTHSNPVLIFFNQTIIKGDTDKKLKQGFAQIYPM